MNSASPTAAPSAPPAKFEKDETIVSVVAEPYGAITAALMYIDAIALVLILPAA